jgi:hypothetical protein
MAAIVKDKDPILEQKFFDFLFPLAFPGISGDIYTFCKNVLSVEHASLPSGTLLEIAISVQKGITRHPTIGRDFVDGSDAKSASCRWSSNNRSYSAQISDISNKKGLLRCAVYERLHNKFYFFLIPHAAYAHIPKTSNIEVGFNLDGAPKRTPGNNTIINWWDFEVPDFSGILADHDIPFTNYRNIRAEKARIKKAESALRKANKAAKKVATELKKTATKDKPKVTKRKKPLRKAA